MESDRQREPTLKEVYLSDFVVALRHVWWKVVLLSLAGGIGTLLVTFRHPDMYRATAVITPTIEERKQNPGLMGALAYLGIESGGPSTVEILETLFESRDLTVRVFRKHNLWPIVMGRRFDPVKGKLYVTVWDRILGVKKEPTVPGNWDAVRAARDLLEVTVNKKSGTVSISFESPSAEGSAAIVEHYLEEGKNRLQEEALERAGKNKRFIEDQIGRTIDVLIRERLYALLGHEMEKEMLARNREQFGFKVVDPAMAPDRKARPHRAKTAVFATLLSLPVWALIFTLGTGRRAIPSGSGGDAN